MVFIRNVVDRMIKGGDRVGLPPGTRRPMKDDAVYRPIPFRSPDLFDLMFENFVSPDPVQKIGEPRIVRCESETIRSEGVVRVITRSNSLTVVQPF